VSRFEVVRWADVKPLPWKNGAGVTRELASSPGQDGFDWRISVAEVTSSGEFSPFPTVDRTIVLLEGAAMNLIVDGHPHQLSRFDPFVFSGDLATSCVVPQGPTRDLNVMTRRGRCHARVNVLVVEGSAALQVSGGWPRFVIALDAPLSVTGEAITPLVLNRYDLVQLAGPLTLEVLGNGFLACIEID